ncbi:glycosyltransferase [Nakamurella alba]|nr:glycosyltransferase [Nakamurella alba]
MSQADLLPFPAGVPATDGPALAVVVCAHTVDRLPTLRRLLGALRTELLAGDELVLVVDHHDELLDLARALFPDTLVIGNSGTRGLSDARNTGAAATSAPVVVFVDDDAFPRPGWAAAWRTAFTDPRTELAGGAVHADWQAGRPAWFPDELDWVVGCDYRGLPGDGAVIRNPIGANMAVRRDALVQAGGFHTGLGRTGRVPAGCEETALGIRVAADRGPESVRRSTSPAVDHQVPAQRGSLKYLLRRCFHEGRSKARLAALVGTGAALSRERRFLVDTVLGGVRRGLAGAAREPAAAARAGVLLAGTAATALGYLTTSRRPAPAAVEKSCKVPVVDLEITDIRSTPSEIDLLPDGPVSVLLRRDDLPLASVLLDPATDRRAQIAEILGGALAPAVRTAPLPAAGGHLMVSVVICTLGRDPRLVAAVDAVLRQSHGRLELVVVDNDPDSGRVDALLAGIDDPRLRIVRAPVRGLSHARNRGLQEVAGELIAYTDDDALPDRHWIQQLCAVFAADRGGQVGAVTGLVTPAELRTPQQLQFEQYGAFDKGAHRVLWFAGRLPHDLGIDGTIGARGALYPYAGGEFGSGNNMAFRTALLRELGGFDTALGAGSPAMGGEDLEIFGRTVRSGAVLVYTPAALVRHFHRDNPEDLRKQMFGYGVGMSAVVTGALVSGPGPALKVLRAMPSALRVLLSPTSTKNAERGADYPRELVLIELAGYLAGPWRLLRSRRAARRSGGRFLPPVGTTA